MNYNGEVDAPAPTTTKKIIKKIDFFKNIIYFDPFKITYFNSLKFFCPRKRSSIIFCPIFEKFYVRPSLYGII